MSMKMATQSFRMTLWLTMMHHHNTFGYRKYCPTNTDFSDALNLCCDIDRERSKATFITRHSGLSLRTIKVRLVANGSAVQKILS